MPNPYAGNPAVFPVTFDVPDDSDPPNAALFNVAPEALGDRTAFLFNLAIPGPALSWFSLNTQSNKLIAAAWDPKGAQWWACSTTNTDTVATSVDEGKTWATPTPGSAVLSLASIAVDNAGHVVTTGTGSFGLQAYQFDGSAWHTELILSPGQCTLMEVAWESTQGLWLIFAWDNSGSPKIMHLFRSTDRVTWTDMTLPSAIQNSGGSATQPRIGVGGGNVVLAEFYGGVAYVASATAAAVAVWTIISPSPWTVSTITPTMSTPSVISDPVYVASQARWLVAIKGTNSSVPCTEIWKSDDGGIIWTQLKVLGGTNESVKIIQLATLDPLIVGLSSDGYIYYSVDYGVTWYVSRFVGTAAATARSIWPGDGGFLELDTGGSSDGVQASIRTGKANRIAVTT